MRSKLSLNICGMNSESAVDAAIASVVDYLCFVFFPRSRWSLTPEFASSLMAERSDDFKVVAVVVNPSDKLLEEITNHLAPDIFQLHGSETAEDITNIKQKFNTKIIRKRNSGSTSQNKVSKRNNFNF